MWSIALLTLRERRRQRIWSVLGMVGLVAMVVGIWPTYRDTDIGAIYSELPESMQSVFGLEGTAFSGAVFIQAELMSLMVPLVLVGLGIFIGASTIAGEVAAGRMDVLLSTGLTRQRLVLGRVLGVAAQLLVVTLATGATLVLGGELVDLGLDLAHVAASLLLAWLLSVLYGALSIAVACWLGRAGAAAGIVSGIAVTSWLVSSLGSTVSQLESASRVLAFHAFADGPPLIQGLDVGNLAFLAAEVVVVTSLAVWGFARRDVG